MGGNDVVGIGRNIKQPGPYAGAQGIAELDGVGFVGSGPELEARSASYRREINLKITEGVGRIGARDIFLPVQHGIAVRVRGPIGRIAGIESELGLPRIRDAIGVAVTKNE